jgi:hypothetical protein
MYEFTWVVVNAQVGVRGANPVGKGKDANPLGGLGLVPGMCPHSDYGHRCSGQRLLCVLGQRGRGGGVWVEGGGDCGGAP